MGHRRSATHWFNLFGAAGLVLAALVGCSGDDGAAGPAGSNAVATVPATSSTNTALNLTITGASINSAPVVHFSVSNQNGQPVTGFADTDFRINISKLMPGAAGSPAGSYNWQSYLNRVDDAGVGVVGSQERKSATAKWGTLTSHGDGTYTYTFATDITNPAANPCPAPCTDVAGNALDISYQPNLTHRVGIQFSNTALPRANATYDFVPAGGAVTARRDIVKTGNCNECHGRLAAHGGGHRVETNLCVTCHNPGSWDATGGNAQTVDFKVMIHKIHRGASLPSVVAGGTYVVAGHDYSTAVFPQDIRNCTKCHDGADSATPQGNNWTTIPSRAACGACHDSVNFADGTGHAGGAQTDDSQCASCHSNQTTYPNLYVPTVHVTNNPTTHNPSVPTGAVNFTYEISGVTVSGTQPVIKFRILKDGTPVTFDGTTTVLSGFTGAPSFVIAYAMAQDGVMPAEYTNYRPTVTSGGQPQTVSIANLTSTGTWVFNPATSYGTLSAPDPSGYYTATITATSREFPAGSTLRAVGLQGYFTQVYTTDRNGDGVVNTSDNLARHAVSVTKAVTGDTARRAVVDNAKCANCHEWLELHGGNRTYETGVCVMCHNPNLSSSGRGANPLNLNAANRQALIDDGYNPDDPSTYPEATNNFKNMIHGIHGSGKRTTPYRFVRDRGTSGVFYYDWSHVEFPGILKTCETCHKAGTAGGYDIASLPAGTLMSIDLTTDGNGATTHTQDRGTVPNPLDLVSTPIAATCVMCHDTASAKAHITGAGGFVATARSTATGAVEQCVTCHGPGRVAAISEVHAR